MAKTYQDLGQYRESCQLYREVLRRDPANGTAFHGLITCLVHLDEVAEAQGVLQQYLPVARQGLLQQLAAARVWLHTGHLARAVITYANLLTAHPDQRSQISSHLEEDIRRLSANQLQGLINTLEHHTREERFLPLYLLALILDNQYQKAVTVYNQNRSLFERSTDPVLTYWLGWAHFKTGRIARAKPFFHQLLLEPGFEQSSRIGLAYCFAREGDVSGARALLNRMPDRDINVLFAKAYASEREGRFLDAIHFYDRILDSGDNPLARRLRILAQTSLGCTTNALKQAQKQFPDSQNLRLALLGDQAMHSIRWQEPDQALYQLQRLLLESEQPRFQYDALIALVDENRMKEAVSLYERLAAAHQVVPYWALDKVAKAYLYLEQPHTALQLYNDVLDEAPLYFNAQMGKLYTLLELRKWTEADQLLQNLERNIPRYIGQGKTRKPNPDRMEVFLARAWWYAYQDRLAEAERYLDRIRSLAPANVDIRNILAHVYYWRGWPRKARQEFAILHSLEPEFTAAETGRIQVLNDLGDKILARNLARQLLTEQPANKHVQQLNRQLQIEDMRELVFDGLFYTERNDSTDLRLQSTLYQPISPWTRVFAQALWNEVKDQDLLDDLSRVGLGVEHSFSSSWQVVQKFSTSLHGRSTPASYTSTTLTPDDHWTLRASYDTHTLDIPAQARVRGIDAYRWGLAIQYRVHESRLFSLEARHTGFDDNNKRNQLLFGYQEGLFTGNDWRAGLNLDLYASSNSREDAPYFNPARDFSGSLTLMAEQTLKRIYTTSFVHRLFLTGGVYNQEGYSSEPLWAVRYEQEHDFSDVHALILGGSWSNRAYDGNDTSSFTIDITYRYHF